MKIGFIGTGNMGTAIIKGYVKKDEKNKNDILAFDKASDKVKKLVDECGIIHSHSTSHLMQNSDIVILAVKPDIYGRILEEIRPLMKREQILVSIAAGITISYLESFFDFPVKAVRTMPNTPALVNEGITALSKNENIDASEFETVINIFNSIGKTEIIDEKLMDIIPGVSGSSPAYVYMFIEALADGAVLQGMPRNKAYQFAAQSVLGAARMVIETGKHPGELKDMVCSPGGTTIEAVAVLEDRGMRSAVIEAVAACTEKSRKMSK